MNNYFEFDEEEFRKIMLESFNYEEDPLYNKNLNINCTMKINKKDLGNEKILRYKVDNKMKQTKIKIPNELENGQQLVLIKEGEKENNKYGNLIVVIKIK
mgnify:CR=1 FL=1